MNIQRPKTYSLPVNEGFDYFQNYQNKYWKNPFDEVTVIASISRGVLPVVLSYEPDQQYMIATLPIGFRPSESVHFPVLLRTTGSTLVNTVACLGIIDHGSGGIYVNIPVNLPTSNFRAAEFSVSYLAAQ